LERGPARSPAMGGGLSSADAPCCCAEVSDRLETLPEARLLEQVNACQESEASCQVLQWRPLPIPEWPARSSAAAAALGDGRVLLLGGTDGQSFLQEVWRRTELGGWQKLPIPPWSARMDAASVTLPSGEVWLVGGESADREPLREVWCTGDGGSTWKELPKPPWNARARCAVTVLSGSAVLVMGGWGLRGTLLGDVWLTEDNGHSWVQLSKPAWGPRESATAMTCEGGLNGIVLLVGGFNPQGQSLAEVSGTQHQDLHCRHRYGVSGSATAGVARGSRTPTKVGLDAASLLLCPLPGAAL